MKENKELNEDFIFKFNNFYKKILNIIIILTIIIVCVYLNDIYNKYNSQLSEIDSLHYICKENLKNCLTDFAEYKLVENDNQVDLYDNNKKEYRCLSLFSINIGG